MVVVIFKTELRADADIAEYDRANRRMREIVGGMRASSMKGYVAADGEEISVARFRSREALAEWRTQPEHMETQRKGREAYYERYSVEVLDTIRAYEFSRETGRVPHASAA